MDSSPSSPPPSPQESAGSNASADDPASSPPADAPDDSSSFEKWLVRFFLIVAFGVAFGIEGMTLFRSFVLDRDDGPDEATVETAPELPQLQVGDDVLPDAPPTERIEALALEARQGDTWTFRMEIALQNPTEQPYELTTFGVLTRSGRVHEESFRATCPPGGSARLVAEWEVAASDIPESLVASGRVQVTPDSSVVHARRFQLPRIPVQMAR